MVDVIQLNKARIWKCREFKNNPPWDDRVSVCVIKQIFAALGECYPRVTHSGPSNRQSRHSKEKKRKHKNILFNKASLPPPPLVPWRTRAQAAAGLISDVMLPAPPPH